MHNRQSSRAIAGLFKFLAIATILALGTSAWAGPAVPPLELLFAPESRLVMGTLVEINPAGRLVFKREKVFGTHKDVPELVDAAVTSNALEDARLEQRYIVGYTTFQNDRQYPAGITPPRKATNVISSSGLDPAVFRDSPELRRILDRAASERGRESRALRRLLLQTFATDDAALQRLAAAQFALDASMSGKLDAADRAILQRAALSDKTNPTTRSLLITAAADRPDDFGPWAAEAINKVLEITPVDGYPSETRGPAGLVLLAFDEASDRGVHVPFASLTRWLRSPQRLYLERASGLIESRYRGRAKAAYEEVLGDAGADPAARQFLEARLRDTERFNAAPETPSN